MSREDTSIALYYRVAETLKGRIASSRYGPGAILPPENTLAQEFNVSSITIRRAMALLVDQGLVKRRRGIGTQVVEKREDRIPLRITGNFRDWIDSAVNRRLNLKVEVLGISVVPCPFSVAKRFSLPSGAPIWQMKRVRKRKGEPISFYVNYAPPALIQDWTKRDFSTGPFVDLFQKKSKKTISRIAQQVEAVVADLDVGAVLGLKFGDPLFFVTHTYFTPEDLPVLVTHMYFRGDRYLYQGRIMLEAPGERPR